MMHRDWLVGFSYDEDYGEYEDYEGVSVVEMRGIGGMYYPSETAQYTEEKVIHYEGDWGSGRGVEDGGLRMK